MATHIHPSNLYKIPTKLLEEPDFFYNNLKCWVGDELWKKPDELYFTGYSLLKYLKTIREYDENLANSIIEQAELVEKTKENINLFRNNTADAINFLEAKIRRLVDKCEQNLSNKATAFWTNSP